MFAQRDMRSGGGGSSATEYRLFDRKNSALSFLQQKKLRLLYAVTSLWQMVTDEPFIVDLSFI
jgi:hypothetical protein